MKAWAETGIPHTAFPGEQAPQQRYPADIYEAASKTSWGGPQSMGFNHKMLGYETPVLLALAYQRSVLEQIGGLFAYIRHTDLISPIKRGDWQTVARKYNGPGQVPTYAAAIARHVEAAEILQEQPIHPAA